MLLFGRVSLAELQHLHLRPAKVREVLLEQPRHHHLTPRVSFLTTASADTKIGRRKIINK